ncbi:dimethyladenosine transferase [Rhodococcus sp. Leaf7]|uniref:SRPBCC family protein n=1 Tax=unclassified Rhodococcus (in: high G+C Gram-positive bacteria) TaxID=192944 RepID=UPI0005AC28DE|nr:MULTISPECIES: SRPBCC family protein [unclassified Rhodococcus (in: high G+C Gram-positive bacteria)]KIQ19769.1 dimethyladenosine transferase [Rhodococcus sp. MEB064]KQU07672.1 dimethyladenosine transferase [Rhodococcus sp. Leaf7]KQU43192.1 dimethyladenosine transferase [Rhodococcus sp. Leaf247]
MTSVTTVDRGDRVIARRVTVNASADELFAQVADPHRHGELDGSGTVKDTVKGPSPLSNGAKFSVKMKQFGLPYRITSTVTEFVDTGDTKVIEWQHPLGHKWRWEFAQTSPTTTDVTESFIYGTAKAPAMLELTKQTDKNVVGITATLEQLANRYA